MIIWHVTCNQQPQATLTGELDSYHISYGYFPYLPMTSMSIAVRVKLCLARVACVLLSYSITAAASFVVAACGIDEGALGTCP